MQSCYIFFFTEEKNLPVNNNYYISLSGMIKNMERYLIIGNYICWNFPKEKKKNEENPSCLML